MLAERAEDPFFVRCASGTTGKPEDVIYSAGGYLLGEAMTHRPVFDYHRVGIHLRAADVGRAEAAGDLAANRTNRD